MHTLTFSDIADGDVDWHILHNYFSTGGTVEIVPPKGRGEPLKVPARLLLRYAAEAVRAEKTRQIEDFGDLEILGLRD